MGLIHSVFCSITFCFERILTWVCCAGLMIMMLMSFIILMVYGISIGYHYAQKELADFAAATLTTTPYGLRMGDGLPEQPDNQRVVRLVGGNDTVDRPPLEKRSGEQLIVDNAEIPKLNSEPVQLKEMKMVPQGKELAMEPMGRYRRSENFTTTQGPFLRPLSSLKNATKLLLASRT